MTQGTIIDEEVRAIARLDLEGLRAEWRTRYGPPPKLRSPELVALALAWRIQAAVSGGLDAATRRRLRQPTGAPVHRDDLGVGARISREWRGRIYEVSQTGDGFSWDGRSFTSLSAVAQAITGAKHNGPKFFGLRPDEQSS